MHINKEDYLEVLTIAGYLINELYVCVVESSHEVPSEYRNFVNKFEQGKFKKLLELSYEKKETNNIKDLAEEGRASCEAFGFTTGNSNVKGEGNNKNVQASKECGMLSNLNFSNQSR